MKALSLGMEILRLRAFSCLLKPSNMQNMHKRVAFFGRIMKCLKEDELEKSLVCAKFAHAEERYIGKLLIFLPHHILELIEVLEAHLLQ